MVDLSVPRNIHPDVARIRHIHLADLDDLQAATDAAYHERLAAVPAARALVAHELHNFHQWLAAQRVAPTIRAFSEKLEDIRRQELAHVQHKLSDAELQAVERVTERLVKKIAALGIDQLRAHAHATPEAEDWLRALFRLEAEPATPPNALPNPTPVLEAVGR
jgi:glutamyl-tRNA reductase